MQAPQATLAIDAGQSGIKFRYRDPDQVAEWAVGGIRTDLPLAPQLSQVMVNALAGRTVATVGIGSSGFAEGTIDAADLLAAAAPFGATQLRLAHDSITAYLGALGDARGAVTAAGTGVVTLAVGANEVTRVDGWGYLIGDAGSGYWIGAQALTEAMRQFDGRSQPTGLLEMLRRDFVDPTMAYLDLQSDEGKVGRIAAYAREVAELAEHDSAARNILERAGAALAESAIAGLRVVGELSSPAPQVCGVGAVFGSSLVRDAFEAAVRAQVPAAQVTIGESHPLDGAERLLAVSGDSALLPHIAHASRPQQAA
ncbi:MAG TPA: BadF/BadG/BcrA/BcrD ATPase family protein [Candidatus Lumbricidophila sp.]|nr:BadF/BadG/BcrA/BcrD ATPase family protein [Candidatus Lumbricidophila sp.]